MRLMFAPLSLAVSVQVALAVVCDLIVVSNAVARKRQ